LEEQVCKQNQRVSFRCAEIAGLQVSESSSPPQRCEARQDALLKVRFPKSKYRSFDSLRSLRMTDFWQEIRRLSGLRLSRRDMGTPHEQEETGRFSQRPSRAQEFILPLSQGGASLALGYSLAAPSGRMLAQLVHCCPNSTRRVGLLLMKMTAIVPMQSAPAGARRLLIGIPGVSLRFTPGYFQCLPAGGSRRFIAVVTRCGEARGLWWQVVCNEKYKPEIGSRAA
jgi:hypothetical protein